MKESLYYDQAQYLYTLQRHGIQPGLDRIRALLALLGNPNLRFPSLHIGGTNGKGSTAAMTAAILRHAGYRVGLYTSPHLIDFTERITINNVPIPHETVARWTEQIRNKIASAQLILTFFEFVTVLAFCYFEEAAVDIAVVEVGLGGRFDATNVVSPLVTAITQVDLDHQEYLGPTILDIAYEKAGIIKPGVPIITGVTQPEVFRFIEEEAKTCNAPLVRLGRDITVFGEDPMQFIFQGRTERTISCPLRGKHQIQNASIAVGMIEALQSTRGDLFSISENDILEGIKNVTWPGRLQEIQTDPRILLDGAHNPAGAQALSDFLQTVDPERLGRHILMVGILKDKDIPGILKPITPWADEIVFTQPDVERAADPKTLEAAMEHPIPMTVHAKVSHAIASVASRMKPSDTLVITGSLYTVGEALAYFKGGAPSFIRG